MNDTEARDEMAGVAAILEEIYTPCWRGDTEPCRACVEIGVQKAYEFGRRQGEKAADLRVEALIGLKREEKF